MVEAGGVAPPKVHAEADIHGVLALMDTGLPLKETAWCQIVATAIDLLTWTRLLASATVPALARATPATFRTRALHLAARITRTARRLHLHLDTTSRHALDVAAGWARLRAAFT